jgi:hypothetical protein
MSTMTVNQNGMNIGHILSREELARALNLREDIFFIERDKKLKKIMPIMFILGISLGIYFTTVALEEIDPDFYERQMVDRKVKLIDDIDLTKPELIPEKPKKVVAENSVKKFQPPKTNKINRTNNAPESGGERKARLTRETFLHLLSSSSKSVTTAQGDMSAIGGFEMGIDQALMGVNSLANGGDGGVGRRGPASVGAGNGFAPGFNSDGGSGGIGDLIDNLLGGVPTELKLKPSRSIKIQPPEGANMASIGGGRSRSEINRVVRSNMASLRYAYNRRLKANPLLKGKIKIRWAIDEFGKVMFCKVEESSFNDPQFEQEIISKIKRWAFGTLNKPGDVTEIVYPFVFTQ